MFNKVIEEYRAKLDRLRRSLQIYGLPLELVLYVLGTGAFCIFARWLQTQMAFNEKGLSTSSVWNYLVPVIILAGYLVMRGFWKRFERNKLTISEDFSEALSNYGRVYTICRWGCGGIMILGALLVFLGTETDINAGFYRVLAVFAAIAGLSFPLFLDSANAAEVRTGRSCLLALPPVLMCAVWVVTCYKANSINSVLWSFAVELLAICVSMNAFFRMAGFVFGTPAPRQTFIDACCGSFLCMMCLADERYLGIQFMFLSAGLMQALCVWLLAANLRKVAPAEPVPSKNSPKHNDTDANGFTRL